MAACGYTKGRLVAGALMALGMSGSVMLSMGHVPLPLIINKLCTSNNVIMNEVSTSAKLIMNKVYTPIIALLLFLCVQGICENTV